MERHELTPELARCLVARSFPAWAHLPIRPVALSGWDNVTFRLGDALAVRLPSADGYVPQVAKEHRWLPVLGPSLPVEIPRSIALGEPGCGYDRPWSVRGWLEGEPAALAWPALDEVTFARDLGGFLAALHAIEATGGPAAGARTFWRGGPLAASDAETRAAIAMLAGRIDGPAALRTWEDALDRPWAAAPVWVHGDLVPSNLLVRDGRLAGVLDFGCCAVGDPACDLVMTWTSFADDAAAVFRSAVRLDDATWARGRAWALWKALITLRDHLDDPAAGAATARRFGWRLDAAGIIQRACAEDPG